jgi:hypothetical protein
MITLDKEQKWKEFLTKRGRFCPTGTSQCEAAHALEVSQPYKVVPRPSTSVFFKVVQQYASIGKNSDTFFFIYFSGRFFFIHSNTETKISWCKLNCAKVTCSSLH